jgi:hypothetical protein
VEIGIFRMVSGVIKCVCVCVFVRVAFTNKESNALFVTGNVGKRDLETSTIGRRSGPTCLTKPRVVL